MTTRDEVLAKLAELPDTADGIAAYLAERGVRGEPLEACACPIARYLTDEPRAVWVGVDDIEPYLPPTSGPEWRVPLPQAVINFIHRFDKEDCYPELIA